MLGIRIFISLISLFKQTAIRNQVKKPRTSKSKKRKSTENDEHAIEGVVIEMNQHVLLTFSLKYLANFSKSSSLLLKVQLMMSNDVPPLVSFIASFFLLCRIRPGVPTWTAFRGCRPPHTHICVFHQGCIRPLVLGFSFIGVVSYQLYVDATQMFCKFLFSFTHSLY